MSGINSKFKNETLGNNSNMREKIHYLGDLRIVGQVVEKLSDKEPIGYVVMTEKTQQFKMYTVGQTMVLLQKFKFVNADIQNGKIVNTECSMERMPKFNTSMQVVGNHGIIILGEIVDGTSKIGYRAMDTNAMVVDLSEDDLLKCSMPIINAKIVSGTAGKKPHISGIKQEFTKIEKSKLKDMVPTKKINPWVKEKHMEKLRDFLLPSSIKWGFTGIGKINDNWYYRTNNSDGYRYLDLDKEAKIIISEVLTESNGITLSDSDKELIKRIVKEMPHKHELVSRWDPENKYTADENDKLFIFALAQFLLNNKQICNEVLNRRIKIKDVNLTTFKKLLDMGYATPTLKKAAEYLQERKVNNYKKVNKIATSADKTKMFKTKTFITGEEAAQLGFALTESNKGLEYRTNTGHNKTLAYIGDYFKEYFDNCDYAKYKSESRCLGDILAIANVIKLMSKCIEEVTTGNNKYLPFEKMMASIEIIIAISFLYESKAMKMFVDDFRADLDNLGVNIPDYEEVSSTDYKLSPELKMYYASGFNVFLNDSKYRQGEYKKAYLKESEIINYRQYGNKYNIQHPMLQDELASIVTMVTSNEYCDAESVAEYIGNIRFL